MQNSALIPGRAASKDVGEMVEGTCNALSGADMFMSHIALSFKYVRGILIVCGKSSHSIESVIDYVAGVVLSAEGRGVARCGLRCCTDNTKQGWISASLCWVEVVSSVTSGRGKLWNLISDRFCMKT